MIYADYRRRLIASGRVRKPSRDRAIGGPQAPHVREYRANSGQSLIVLGDRLARKPHLTSFLQSLRQENNEPSKEREVTFAVCTDTNEVAVTRVLARRSRIVMVIDPALNALGNTEAQRALLSWSCGRSST